MTSSTCASCGSDASLSAFIELRGLKPESCPHDPPCCAACPRLMVGLGACVRCLDADMPAVSERSLLDEENRDWVASVLRSHGFGAIRREDMRLVWVYQRRALTARSIAGRLPASTFRV